MFNKVVEAIEPFALTLIIFAGATLTGWVKVTNPYVIGVAVVFIGVLLTVVHVIKKLKKEQ